jgi:segregation and condensation protein A
MSYRVELSNFCGPLDLLLYLVRKNEVDVLDIPIARITAQFREYLEVLELLDLDLVGEFVVMASTLMEIKSRLVSPHQGDDEPAESNAEEDPRAELVQQLLEYKRYRDAAKALEDRAAQWHDRFPRLANDQPKQGKDHSADRIKDVELWDLVSALARVLRRKDVQRETSIRYDETPIQVHMERISQRVRSEGRVPFSSFFEGTNLRSRIVGIFLAILELLRHHAFRAEQPTEYGEIWILPPMNGESTETTTTLLASLEEQLPEMLGDAES